MCRSTVPCGWPLLCAKQAKASIPVPEEVPKRLASSLPDSSSGWTVVCHIPHTPSRCPHGATLLPCVTVRCYCSMAASHDVSTTPKVASVVNVLPPMPGPVTPVRGQPGPCSIRMRHWKMISKLNICWSAT